MRRISGRSSSVTEFSRSYPAGVCKARIAGLIKEILMAENRCCRAQNAPASRLTGGRIARANYRSKITCRPCAGFTGYAIKIEYQIASDSFVDGFPHQ